MQKENANYVVKDNDIKGFVAWLENKGFINREPHIGWWDGVSWVFVNPYTKTFVRGMPGIKMCQTVSDERIPSDEFKAIYSKVSQGVNHD